MSATSYDEAATQRNRLQNKEKFATLARTRKEPEVEFQVEFPTCWGDEVRAAPNLFLRSSLFSVVRKGQRKIMKREQIAAQGNVEIFYTGEQLDQADLDNWLMILHLVYKNGNRCSFSAASFLSLMSRTDGGDNRVALDDSLSRMKASSIKIRGKVHYSYEGSLLDEIIRDEETRAYQITVNPRLAPLFMATQFTLVYWTVRQELARKPLAQWLHAFYSSHARPFDLKVETLHLLCGSTAQMKRFKQTLRNALQEVVAACTKHKQKFGFNHESFLAHDLVCIARQPSASQQLHLIKKTVKKKGAKKS
jgi:TrfA protein